MLKSILFFFWEIFSIKELFWKSHAHPYCYGLGMLSTNYPFQKLFCHCHWPQYQCFLTIIQPNNISIAIGLPSFISHSVGSLFLAFGTHIETTPKPSIKSQIPSNEFGANKSSHLTGSNPSQFTVDTIKLERNTIKFKFSSCCSSGVRFTPTRALYLSVPIQDTKYLWSNPSSDILQTPFCRAARTPANHASASATLANNMMFVVV